MADSPTSVHENRSLKAGGRLNRWSFKAGFTVNEFCSFPREPELKDMLLLQHK